MKNTLLSSRARPQRGKSRDLWALLFVFLIVPSSHALDLTPDGFEQQNLVVQEKYKITEAKITSRLRKKIRNTMHDLRAHLSPEEMQIKKAYFQAKKDKEYVDGVRRFRDELNRMYLKDKNVSVDQQKLNRESTLFALEIFSETEKLKKQYRSFGIPVVHNMMISVGIRKRGACKDWAEDLLNHMIPIERKYFQLAWGEANPRKINEHNVLVVYPRYAQFENGLIVDPWRTSGKVLWLYVTEDHHYKWHPWQGFGVY